MNAWQSETDPEQLVRFARGRVSDRKLRLFACACGRRVDPTADGVDAELLELAERVADNRHSGINEWHTALGHASGRSFFARRAKLAGIVWSALQIETGSIGLSTLRFLAGAVTTAEQLELVREVFGNPFRPIDFAPWRTDTAMSLARQMYESLEFGAMPILADALQDAGCDNDEVLNHCRGAGPHVRGCWVVDGVLGLV